MRPYEADATIEKLSQEGRGLTHVGGLPTFVRGALPGETVRLKVLRRHRKIQEAVCLEVLGTPHPERVPPACDHFGVCGGCSLQHWNAEAQMAFKQEALVHQVTHALGRAPERVLPSVQGSVYGYRHRGRISLRWVRKKERFCLGFREALGGKVTDSHHCPILHPVLDRAVRSLVSVMTQCNNKEIFPQIEMSMPESGWPALVLRVMAPLAASEEAALKTWGQEQQVRLYLQEHADASRLRLLQDDQPFELTSTVAGQRLTYHPLGFAQTHQTLNAKMVAQALAGLALHSDDDVVDLFCGMGNFTLPIAAQGARVLGVEGNSALVASLQENAQANGCSDRLTGMVCDLFANPLPEALKQRKPTKVLLDPPRTGALNLVPLIAAWQPERIVYVSCQASTLARDLAAFQDHGYVVESLGVLDMFPHTTHSEGMAFLKQRT